jgi:hypothetical protein
LENGVHDDLGCTNVNRTHPAELTDRVDWKYYACFSMNFPCFPERQDWISSK